MLSPTEFRVLVSPWEVSSTVKVQNVRIRRPLRRARPESPAVPTYGRLRVSNGFAQGGVAEAQSPTPEFAVRVSGPIDDPPKSPMLGCNLIIWPVGAAR